MPLESNYLCKLSAQYDEGLNIIPENGDIQAGDKKKLTARYLVISRTF